MNDDQVRVRFAPSPTGYLHVGGARTALFNWLFARHEGGRFVLRIEDTDRERSSSDLEEVMLEDMRWLGLEWDEGPDNNGESGPYRQSDRLDLYRKYVDVLIGGEMAYPCFCSDRTLEDKKRKMISEGAPPRYDGTCRDLSEEEIAEKRKRGLPESVRFKIESEREERIDDIIRGEVVFPPGMVGDFVILRSNGLPTYNFAAALDDSLMGITHVIRGEEHLSNTLRQLMIYRALGMETPRFAHIPLILGADRAKLSKRHGAPNVKDYRREGYPANALVNYLAMLGWSSPGEKEIQELDELIEEFTLQRVSSSPSIFDKEKLRWVCAQHIRLGGAERYFNDALPYFPESFRERYSREDLKKIFEVVSENLAGFSELEEAASVFKPGFPKISPEGIEALSGSRELLEEFIAELGRIDEWDPGNIREAIKNAGKACGRKGRELYLPFRAALTGETHGPDLSSVLLIRGKKDVIAILKKALKDAAPK